MPTFAIAVRLNATRRSEDYVPAAVLAEYGLRADPAVPGLFEGERLASERLAALLGELAEAVRAPEALDAVESGLLDDLWVSLRRDG